MKRKDILNDFDMVADKKWAADKNHINIINSKATILGVRTPKMKELARKYAKSGVNDAILALKSEYFEENLLHGLLLGYVGDSQTTFDMLIEFLPRIDNWAVCDQTCASLKVFKKDKENKYFDKFLTLAHSKQEFFARTGIVMLMTYYLKQELIDKIFDCLTAIENHEYYVDMASAWLVSVAITKFCDKTCEFLKTQKLQKRVQNKAICKCRDSFRVEKCKKDEIKKYRIK